MSYSDKFIALQKKAEKTIRERDFSIPDPELREAIAQYVGVIVQEAYVLGQSDAVEGLRDCWR